MIIGVPREVKAYEFRVAAVPSLVRSLVDKGHEVVIESGAGEGSGIPDELFSEAGGRLTDVEDVWRVSELILKVKEPQPEEWPRIRPGRILFLYFHFASSRELTRAMVDSGATCIAMETLEADDGRHPLLVPMSEIAGRLSVIEGAKYLQTPLGGRGVLLSGVNGVPPAQVLVIGAGAVGTEAARTAAVLGAQVTLMDVSLQRLREVSASIPNPIRTLYASPSHIREQLPTTDLVIAAAHRVGAHAPHLLTRDDLKLLPRGAVLIDVGIDQGGSFETSRPTTHADPTYTVDGIIHYCVANMPGCVARTSTLALTNASAPFIHRIADLGFPEVIRRDSTIRRGVNIVEGMVTHAAVAHDFQLKHTPIEDYLLKHPS